MALDILRNLIKELNRRFDAGKDDEALDENSVVPKELWLSIIALYKKNSKQDEKLNALLRVPRPVLLNLSIECAYKYKKQQQVLNDWHEHMITLQKECNLYIKPLDTNLLKWRNLWKVLNTSDVIVQVVDARNPLLNRCIDVENFVRELGANKVNILLLNKADLLNDIQRLNWNKYLTEKGVDHAFFSATTKEINIPDSKPTKIEKPYAQHGVFGKHNGEHNPALDPFYDSINMGKIFTPKALLNFIITVYRQHSAVKYENRHIQVAIIGGSNVGKRRVFNVLQFAEDKRRKDCNASRTIKVSEELSFCHCSDILLPNVTTKVESILTGIERSNADELENLAAAFVIICRRIPLRKLLKVYPREYFKGSKVNGSGYLEDSTEFFTTLASIKDIRGVTKIISDYVKGKLVYVKPPPYMTHREFNGNLRKRRAHVPLSKQLKLNASAEPIWKDELPEQQETQDLKEIKAFQEPPKVLQKTKQEQIEKIIEKSPKKFKGKRVGNINKKKESALPEQIDIQTNNLVLETTTFDPRNMSINSESPSVKFTKSYCSKCTKRNKKCY